MTRSPGRIAAIDIARGVSLVGMGVYHLTWDLADFGLASADLPYSGTMRIVSHIVGGAFLLLAGISLGIAHRRGPNWRGFAKRLAIVASAAALVSLATLLAAPDSPIFFGILHCIAVASLLAAPFLGLAAWTALLAGAAAIAAPLLYQSDKFNSAALIWLGLGTREPLTLDWRPLLPWAGVTLLGLGLAKLGLPALLNSPLARWRPRQPSGRGFAFAGRHSLAIYLIHQPVLFALLYAGTQWTGVEARRQGEHYLATCRTACVEAGGELEACATACACVAGKAKEAGLMAALVSHDVSADDRARITTIVGACESARP